MAPATAARRALPALALLCAALAALSQPALSQPASPLTTTSGCTCDTWRDCGFLQDGEELPSTSFVGDASSGAFCYVSDNTGCSPSNDIISQGVQGNEGEIVAWDYCGYTWDVYPDDLCYTYSDTDGWAWCTPSGDPAVTSTYNVYCFDLNGAYSSGGPMADTYCGVPIPKSDFTLAGGYWFSNADTCTLAVCSAAEPPPSSTGSSDFWNNYYYGNGGGGSSDAGGSNYAPTVTSSEWSNYEAVPLPQGISFPWTSLTSWGCTCTSACQSGPLTSSETDPRDFTWCTVQPGCGPGDVWDAFDVVNYDICGYALNISALSMQDDDFLDCAATDLTQCTSPTATVPGTAQPKPWKIQCSDPDGKKSPHPGWYDCYTGSVNDQNYLTELIANASAACTYSCIWWDAATYGGYPVGGWPPEPAPPPAPPASYISFSLLSDNGPVNVSDVLVLVGYSKPTSRSDSSTSLGPDYQLNLRKGIATEFASFNVSANNVTLTDFQDVPRAALAGRRLLQGNVAVAVTFVVTASGVQAAGGISTALQVLASDPFFTTQQLVVAGLDQLVGVAFPLLPVMQDSGGACMAFTPAAPSPPPSPSYYGYYPSESTTGYPYGGGKSSSSSDWSGIWSGTPSAPSLGTPMPPPPPPTVARPPMPPPPAPPPPKAYGPYTSLQDISTYKDLTTALNNQQPRTSMMLYIQQDIFITNKDGVAKLAAYSLRAMSNITIIGNTSSCLAHRKKNDTNTGPCVLDAGNLTRLFVTSGPGTAAAPTYLNFMNLELSGGRAMQALAAAKSSGGGVLLALDSTVLYIDSCIISGSVASLANGPSRGKSQLHGGAIYLSQPLTVTITNTELSGNLASQGDGGALYIDQSRSSCNISLSNVTFSQNRGVNGGALAFDTSAPSGTDEADLASYMAMSNATFDRNQADDSGGAIFAGSLYSLSDTNGEFTRNLARGGTGGALAGNYYASSYAFSGSSFVGNAASDEGGAVAFVDIEAKVASPISFTASGTTWSNNTVTRGVAAGATGNGGALSLSCFQNVGSKCVFTVAITNSTLALNRGKGAGGALYVGSALSVNLTDTAVRNNLAIGPYARGGGVAAENALSVAMLRCTYNSNNVTATLAPDPVVSRPGVVYVGAGDGGAVFVASLSSTWAPVKNLPGSPSTAPRLAAANMSLSGCTFSANWAAAGGAVAASGHATQVSGCAFAGNTAAGAPALGISGDGGAMLVQSFGSTAVGGSTFSNNSAAQRGGAVAALLSPTFMMPNQTSLAAGETTHRLALSAGAAFANNSAALGGGALFLETTPAFNSSASTGVVTFAGAAATGNTALAGAVVLTANCTYNKKGDVTLCTPFALPACTGACVGFSAATAAAAGNVAASHGPFMASAPASFSLAIGGVTSGSGVAVVPSGLPWPSPLNVISSDFYSQTVTAWDDGSGAGGMVFTVAVAGASSVAAAQGSLLVQGTTQTIALPLSGSGAGWTALTATGYELASATLVATAPNYIFPSPQARTASIALQIGVCGPGMTAVGTSCVCVPNALADAGGLSCHCLPSFFLTPPAELAATVYAGVAHMNWTCGSCPPGASCSGDNFFIGTDGYWHLPAPDAPAAPAARRALLAAPAPAPAANVTVAHSAAFFLDTTFYDCRQGLCLAMDPQWQEQNLSAPAPRCRKGHTGPVCELCAEGFSYQGQFCGPCEPADAFNAWSRGRRVALGILVAIGAALGVVFLFFWPLLPNLQAAVYDAARVLADPQAVATEARRRMRMLSTGQHHEREDAATADNSGALSDAGFLGELLNNKFSGNGTALKEQLQKMVKDAAAPMKTLFTFVQLIISFSHSLSVPWPHAYLKISSSLNFVALDFFSMPNTACANPGLLFYTKFMGETLGLTTAIAGIGALYLLGSAAVQWLHFGSGHDTREARKRRRLYFQATCLSRLLLLAYLVYPNISKVIVDMFACRRVGDTNYLMADFRIQCSGARYDSYFSAAIFWTIVYPLGVPAAFLALLLAYDVPRLAARRAQTAWLDAALKEVWRVAALECDTARQLRAAVGVDEALTVSTLPEPRAAQLLEDFTHGAFDESALADSAHLQDETHAVAASFLGGTHPEAHDLKAEAALSAAAGSKDDAGASAGGDGGAQASRYETLKKAHRRIVHTGHHSSALVVLSLSGLLHALAAPFLALAARARGVQAHLHESAQAAKAHVLFKARSLSARKKAEAEAGGKKGCLGKAASSRIQTSMDYGADAESGAPAAGPPPGTLPPGWATTLFAERHRDTLALADAARSSGKLSITPPVWRTEKETEEAMLFAIGRLGVAISRVEPALLASLAEAQAADDDDNEAPPPRPAWLERLLGPPPARQRARRLSALDYMFKLLAVRRARLDEIEAAEAGGGEAGPAGGNEDTDLLVAIRASELKRCLAAATALVATFDDAADAVHEAMAVQLQAEAEAAFAADPPPRLLFGLLPPPPPEAEVPPRPPRGPAGGLRAVAGFLEELLLLYEEGVAVRGLPFLLTSYTCGCWYWELAELMRRALLTVVLAFVAPRTATQVTAGVVIAFATLVLLGLLRPYASPGQQRTAYIAQVELFLFLFVGLLLKVNVGADTGNGNDSVAFNAIVSILSLVVLAVPFVNKVLGVRPKGELAQELAQEGAAADAGVQDRDAVVKLKELQAGAKAKLKELQAGAKAKLSGKKGGKGGGKGGEDEEGEEEDEEESSSDEEKDGGGKGGGAPRRTAAARVDAAVAALQRKHSAPAAAQRALDDSRAAAAESAEMMERQQRLLEARMMQMEAAREARIEAERVAAMRTAGAGDAAADDVPFRPVNELHRMLYESTAQLQVGMQTLQQRFIAVAAGAAGGATAGGAAAPEAEAGQNADTWRQQAPTAEPQGAPAEDAALRAALETRKASRRRRSSSRDRPTLKL